jgi:hypothetical protein
VGPQEATQVENEDCDRLAPVPETGTAAGKLLGKIPDQRLKSDITAQTQQ